MRALVLLLVLFAAIPNEAQSRRRAVGRAAGTTPGAILIHDDFRNGALGWTAGFADYSPATAPVMELDSGIRTLPPELGVSGTGFYFRGHNRSDDLWMFMTKKLTAADGIMPNTLYDLSFRVTVASNSGSNCIGIGGAPGESVYLKVGATPRAPEVTLDALQHYAVNFDKNNQSQSGAEASVAGNIANGVNICRFDAPFVSIVRAHTHTQPVRSNAFGELWLIVGTDSGFEGLTQLYYQTIEATLTPRP